MSKNPRDLTRASLTLFATGIPCFLVSLIILGQRHAVAAMFFGARFLFSVPLTEDDSLKLLFVTCGSLIGSGMGLVLIGAGVIVFARASRVISSTGVPPVPTNR